MKGMGTATTTPTPTEPTPSTDGSIAEGSLVAIKAGTANYYPGSSAIPGWVISDYNHIVTQTTSGGKAVVKGGKTCVLLGKKVNKKSGKEEAGINTWIDKGVLAAVGASTAPTPPAFQSYTVKVTATELNIRKGPGTNYGTNGSIKDKGIYTIVEESVGTGATKWGKLKSGVGWISLDYTQKR